MMPKRRQQAMRKRFYMAKIAVMVTVLLLISGCALADGNMQADERALTDEGTPTDPASWAALPQDTQLQDIQRQVQEAIEESIAEVRNTNHPEGISYTVLNQNVPLFSGDDVTTKSFEAYSKLDGLGRCGMAYACLGTDLAPTEERGAIGQIKPSGWHTVKYDCVDGKYLYNRCHLIGYQLSGENANERNLITGTRYFNTEGMLPFENMVADYLKETKNHVLYRVTPHYDRENLLADGVQMEAWSVEDGGNGISFHVFVHNIQPGIRIDYETGASAEAAETASGGSAMKAEAADDTGTAAAQDTDGRSVKEAGDTAGGSTVTVYDASQEESQADSGSMDKPENKTYVVNTNTKKFHLPDCRSVKKMKGKNRENYNGAREWLIENGYEPCKNCIP